VHGVRPRDRRTINDAKKFPPLHVNPQRAIVSGQLSALIEAGFELRLQSPDVRFADMHQFSIDVRKPE
jgi:hypothetical protein